MSVASETKESPGDDYFPKDILDIMKHKHYENLCNYWQKVQDKEAMDDKKEIKRLEQLNKMLRADLHDVLTKTRSLLHGTTKQWALRKWVLKEPLQTVRINLTGGSMKTMATLWD